MNCLDCGREWGLNIISGWRMCPECGQTYLWKKEKGLEAVLDKIRKRAIHVPEGCLPVNNGRGVTDQDIINRDSVNGW